MSVISLKWLAIPILLVVPLALVSGFLTAQTLSPETAAKAHLIEATIPAQQAQAELATLKQQIDLSAYQAQQQAQVDASRAQLALKQTWSQAMYDLLWLAAALLIPVIAGIGFRLALDLRSKLLAEAEQARIVTLQAHQNAVRPRMIYGALDKHEVRLQQITNQQVDLETTVLTQVAQIRTFGEQSDYLLGHVQTLERRVEHLEEALRLSNERYEDRERRDNYSELKRYTRNTTHDNRRKEVSMPQAKPRQRRKIVPDLLS